MRLVGVDGGDSSTGSRALPGTGFHTPSDSQPRTKDVSDVMVYSAYASCKHCGGRERRGRQYIDNVLHTCTL